MIDNKYNLQIGDKIKYKHRIYTIQSIEDKGAFLSAGFGLDRWSYINTQIDNGDFVILERAKKAFPEKWSVWGGPDLMNFLQDCKSQGLYKLTNYTGNARTYYNFNGQELSDYGKRQFETVTIGQLREHYLNTKETMKEESKKEIIGYNIKEEFKDKERKIAETLDTQIGKIPGAGYWLPNCGSVYNNAIDMGVLDLWFEPVYKEEEVKLTLGTPAKEVVVKKDSVYCEGYVFLLENIEKILPMFTEIDAIPIGVCVKKVWIGCSAGIEVTKDEVLKIIKTAEEL